MRPAYILFITLFKSLGGLSMTNEKQTIRQLIRTIHESLREIYDSGREKSEDFAIGQVYAYIDCLEILQSCPAFRKLGLNYEIEKRFPV